MTSERKERSVRIGGFSAFWGDTAGAARQLLHRAEHVDYLIGDYLAEVTMCILARVKAKMARKKQIKNQQNSNRQRTAGKSSGGAGEGGYVREFLTSVFIPLLPALLTTHKHVKIVTNAGGLNPRALQEGMMAAISAVGAKLKISPEALPSVASVYGDDITKGFVSLSQSGRILPFTAERSHSATREAGRGLPFGPKVSPTSANVYFGAYPIVKALRSGARFVVTGRCTDSALVLAPLIHEYRWDDLSAAKKSGESTKEYQMRRTHYLNLMSAGSLAGHLIECGAQCTGGNFTDWRQATRQGNGYAQVGFPVCSVSIEGDIRISKPPGTGGVVSVGSVAEQLMYEIANPRAYILPDVVCDWSQVTLTQCGDQVAVRGCIGRAEPQHLKVGVTNISRTLKRGSRSRVLGSYMVSHLLFISGFEAAQKAAAVADGILKRTHAILLSRKLARADGKYGFEDVRVELLGAEGTYGPSVVCTAEHTHTPPPTANITHPCVQLCGSRAQGRVELATGRLLQDTSSYRSRVQASREVVLRISARDPDRRKLQLLAREMAPSATCMAPGICGASTGRSRPSALVYYDSVMIPRECVRLHVCVRKGEVAKVDAFSASPGMVEEKQDVPSVSTGRSSTPPVRPAPTTQDTVTVPLIAVAHARSGDKGNTANVGLRARHPCFYPLLLRLVTAEAVRLQFDSFLQASGDAAPVVIRYTMPGIHGLNFLMTQVLGGGGIASLYLDRQGKSYGQKLLSMRVEVPVRFVRRYARHFQAIDDVPNSAFLRTLGDVRRSAL